MPMHDLGASRMSTCAWVSRRSKWHHVQAPPGQPGWQPPLPSEEPAVKAEPKQEETKVLSEYERFMAEVRGHSSAAGSSLACLLP